MNKVKYVIIFLFITSFISCETDDEGNASEPSTVYLEDAFAEIYKLNNIDATPYAQEETSNSISNQVDISAFDGVNLNSFNIRAAAPIDNTLSINASLGSVYIVLKNGDEIPPFYQSGELGDVIEFDGIQRQSFLFNFTYPSSASPIDIGDIDYIYLEYEFDYTANSSGSNVYSKSVNHTVYFEGGSGNGNSCDDEITAVNYTDITFGDACGSPSSVRLYYTNNSNISIRLRFTVVDENGDWSGQNLGFILDPGETTNQHFCYPKIINNQFCYQILIKDVNSICEFPDVQDIPVCNGF